MKKVSPVTSSGANILAQNPPVKGRQIRDASRLSQKPAAEASHYLQIKSVPVRERVNPKEIRYALWIYPHGVRACGGQFTGHEAHQIAKATKGWDWALDENNRLYCLPQLEALIDSIIKRSQGVRADG